MSNLSEDKRKQEDASWLSVRKNAREWIVRFLYAMHMQGEYSMVLLDAFLEEYLLPKEEKAFVQKSMYSIVSHLEEIDAEITSHLKDWEYGRIPKIDTSILRMAINEILFDSAIPVGVSINEAVEIAKKYCDGNSYRFINGILGNVVRENKII